MTKKVWYIYKHGYNIGQQKTKHGATSQMYLHSCSEVKEINKYILKTKSGCYTAKLEEVKQ